MGGEALWWLAVAVILSYVVFVERRSLASIGLRRPGLWDMLCGVLCGVALIAGIVFIYGVVFPLFHLRMNAATLAGIMHTPLWFRVALVTRAAVMEEIVFRGYPIERFQAWTGSRMVAALISVVAFTYAHLAAWGAAQLIVAGYGGVVLAVLYLWRRNLWANMLAHWIADGSGFIFFHP
jgi:membrane protease YdiL (CAAX protease family)